MRGFVILCDFAEAINGKLYIQGGGWSRLTALPGLPVTLTLAGQILLPWDDANRRRSLVIQLFNEDGQEVYAGDPAQPVEVRGEFEVGRPPGITPGSELDFPFATRFEGVPLVPGRYKFIVTAGVERIGEAVFEVITQA
ncbi:DUF6941 family protein [Microbacterium sp. Root180]|uniref:DUF6941 family protein n=1 Tax=Microbacterium sp. Root180 TaxID=1736483 RepID=UPI0006F3AD53|nr:hypothetical protein [Microbacterium sp. Root180]KRB38814.1 hypothetical protein ASD93_02420 [Microbacterium sp. Root180]